MTDNILEKQSNENIAYNELGDGYETDELDELVFPKGRRFSLVIIFSTAAVIGGALTVLFKILRKNRKK